MAKKSKKYIIGIDEVGRGPLAGPVTTAAVLLPRNFQLSIFNFQRKSKVKLRDSKKLSPKQREKWMKWIKNNSVNPRQSASNPRKSAICYAITSTSPKTIDKINISNAANLAATKALKKLLANNRQLTTNNCKIFLDGGLRLPKKIFLNSKFYILNSKTIIRGDEKIPAISLASIVAKVHRDKLMKRFHKQYPHYNFDQHKGYGTRRHFQKIKQNGISKIHRKSFLKNLSL